jgi:hypothetical protein
MTAIIGVFETISLTFIMWPVYRLELGYDQVRATIGEPVGIVHTLRTLLWFLGGGFVTYGVLRGFLAYRASITWPTADGMITRLDVERINSGGTHTGHYFRATFTYDFRDPSGGRFSGSWYKNFSSESEARDFAARELPVDKKVVVRFDPKNPKSNNLELDSWTYTNDRPLDLDLK